MSNTNFAHRACGHLIIMFIDENNHMYLSALEWSQLNALTGQLSLTLGH